MAAASERSGLLLRLPRPLHTALKHVAIDRGTSVTALVLNALEEWWKEQPEARRRYRSHHGRTSAR